MFAITVARPSPENSTRGVSCSLYEGFARLDASRCKNASDRTANAALLFAKDNFSNLTMFERYKQAFLS